MEDAYNKNSSNLVNGELIRLPSFDWDKVKFFYYIAKLKSFSEASKFLNISQSSLSRKINILEHHLKFKLFTRIPKGVELTRKGNELFIIVEQYFLSLKGFTYNSAVTVNNGQKRKIRIATTHPIAAYVLTEPLVAYNLLHPEIILEILAEDKLIDLVISDVDIAIRPYELKAKGVEQEILFTLRKKLFASPNYLEKYGEPQSVDDLINHRVISHPQPEKHPYSDLSWILKIGMPQEEIRIPAFSSNSLESAVIAAQNGIGILGSYEQMSLIQSSGLKNILPSLTDTPLDWYFVYPKIFKNDSQIKNIYKYLYEQLFDRRKLY